MIFICQQPLFANVFVMGVSSSCFFLLWDELPKFYN
jgi:hypothetical protein